VSRTLTLEEGIWVPSQWCWACCQNLTITHNHFVSDFLV